MGERSDAGWCPPRLPRWAVGAWTAIWSVGLLAPSVVGLGAAGRPWWSAGGLAVVGAIAVATLTDAASTGGGRSGTGRSGRGHRNRWPWAALQAVVVVALAADPGLPWGTLPLLVAISIGATITFRWTPLVVAAVAVGAAIIGRLDGASWDVAVWGTGLTTLLAGLLTHAFIRLGQTIGELHRSRAQLARAAVTAERLRFSRDLHDLLGHTLSVMVVKAQAARRSASSDPAGTQQHASDIETIGRQALAEVRQAVQGYRDNSLEEELQGAAEAFRAAGISIDVGLGHAPLSAAQEELVAWVVREGTTNVLRHARNAQHASITTQSRAGGVRVLIEDDGDGGDVADASGSGLTGLGERLRESGGTVDADRQGRGFRLVAFVPGEGS